MLRLNQAIITKKLFYNKDKLTVITVGMKVENTAEEIVSFHPNQAVLTEVIFTLDTSAKDISKIKLNITGASNENLDSLSEDIDYL